MAREHPADQAAAEDRKRPASTQGALRARRRAGGLGIGLTARMLLIVGPVVALTAVMALGLFTSAHNDEQRFRREEQAQLLANSTATLLRDYILRMNTSQITPILRAMASTPPVTCASLRLTGLPQTFGAPVNDCEDGRHAGSLIEAPVRQGEGQIALLSLRLAPPDSEAEFSAALVDEAALLLGLMAAAALVLAFALRRVVTDPIRRLTLAMGELSGGSVEFANPDRSRGDELGEAARALEVFRRTKIQADRTAQDLLDAQQELIEQAKFASLGAMVAGVAHEVNTPIGVCITAMSSSADGVRDIQGALQEGGLSQSKLRDHLDRSLRTAELTLANLHRAANLIRSFKAVAADQATEAPRQLKLTEYLADIIAALQPELKKTKVVVAVDCPSSIELVTQPSAIWQIISNLVLNSLTHAYPDRRAGQIRIIVERNERSGQINLVYQDDGAGMASSVQSQIFEPFFTTRRSEGGTGLGMTIVYNLVIQTLGGRIRCVSAPGEGARFDISFPYVGA